MLAIGILIPSLAVIVDIAGGIGDVAGVEAATSSTYLTLNK